MITHTQFITNWSLLLSKRGSDRVKSDVYFRLGRCILQQSVTLSFNQHHWYTWWADSWDNSFPLVCICVCMCVCVCMCMCVIVCVCVHVCVHMCLLPTLFIQIDPSFLNWILSTIRLWCRAKLQHISQQPVLEIKKKCFKPKIPIYID